MDDGMEDTGSEGWQTPPESVDSFLTDEMKRKLDGILKSRQPITRPYRTIKNYLRSSDDIGIVSSQFGVLACNRDVSLPCHDKGGAPNLNSANRKTMIPRYLQGFAWPHVSGDKSMMAIGPERSDIGKPLDKEKTSETPKIMVKPLMKNPEEEMFEKPAIAVDWYPIPMETPFSSTLEMEDHAKIVGSLSEMDDVKEDTESEGWETPPDSLDSVLTDKMKRKLDAILRSREPPTRANSSTVASIIAPDDKGIVNAQFGVLAYSRDLIVPCQGILGIPDLNPAIRGIMMALKIGNMQGKGLQRFAWPHVSGGKSMVAIGPEASGKTWCFLPSLCQRSHEQQLRRTKDNYGPTSIVVCFNQQQGNQIVQWIIKLLDPLSKEFVPFKGVVTLWEKDSVADVADSGLLRSVGILVTTPEILVLLQKHHTERTRIFDANSVKCLVLDNLSDMVRHMPDTTTKMINWLTQFLYFRPDGCQLFVTTRLWLDTLMRESLLPHMPDALVVFNDPFEASIYAGASLEVTLVEPGEEIRCLLQLLRDRCLDKERIVVVCDNQGEVLDVTNKLTLSNIRSKAIYDINGLRMIKKWKHLGPALVLVVTDIVLNKLKTRVDLLIHYSPALSWTRLKFRFSLFYNNYLSDPGHNPGKSVLLFRHSYLDQMWLLAESMMWHQLPRPHQCLDLLWEHRRRIALQNSDLGRLPLCDHMFAYGDCHRRTCRYRHVLWKEELLSPVNFPTKGEIRFQVLTCNSPTYIVVRQHDLYPVTGTFVDTPMTQFSQELQRHYELERNRLPHKNPKIGDIVIVLNMQQYERAVITRLKSSVGKITVRRLDSGTDALTYLPICIFICDQRFRTKPIQAMEIRLTGIEPDNMERIWTKEALNIVRKQFFSRSTKKETRVFSARIEYVISRTIFVRTVVDDRGLDLRSFLLSRFRIYEEAMQVDKLKKVVSAAKDYPKDS